MRSIILTILLLVFLYFVPSFLSNDSMLSYLLSSDSQTIKVQGATLRWLGPQEIAEIALDKDGVDAQATSIESHTSLFGLITRNIGSTEVQTVTISATKFPTTPTTSEGKFSGVFRVNSLSIRVPSATLSLAELTYAKTADETSLYSQGECTSPQGSGTASISFLSKGPLFAPSSLFKLQASVSKLPTQAIAALGSVVNSKELASLPILLGETVSLRMEGDQAAHQIGADISLYSPLLTCKIRPIATEKGIAIQSKGDVSYILTKKAATLFPRSIAKHVQAETTIQTSIESGMLPYENNQFQIKNAALFASGSVRGGRFGYDSSLFSVDECALSIASRNLSKSVTIRARGQGVFDKTDVVTLQGKVTIADILTAPTIETIDAKATNLPVNIVDYVWSVPASTTVGPYLSGHVRGSNKRYTVTAKTPLYEATNVEFFQDGDDLTSLAPFQLSFTYPHTLEQLSRLSGNVSVESLIVDTKDLYDTSIDGTASIRSFSLASPKGSLKLSNSQMDIKADSLRSIALYGSTVLQVTNSRSIIGAAFPTAMQSQFAVDFNAENRMGTIQAFKLEAPSARGELVGSFDKNRLRLQSKGPITLVPALHVASSILEREYTTAPKLLSSRPWEIHLNKLTAHTSGLINADIQVKTESLDIAAQNGTSQSNLEDVVLHAKMNGETYSVDGSLIASDGRGSLHFDQTNDRIKAHFSTKHIPTKLIDAVTQENYSTLLGDSITSNGSFVGQKQIETASLDFTSPFASGSGAFRKKGERYVLSKPSKLTFNLSPKGFSTLFAGHALTLSKRSLVSMDLDEFSVETEGKFFPPIDSLFKPDTLHAQLTCDEFAFIDVSSNEPFILQSLLATVSLEDKSAPLYIKADTGVDGGGKLVLGGTMQNFLSKDQSFTLQNANIDVKAELKEFPTAVLDILFATRNSISPSIFLGNTLTMNCSAEIANGNGDIKADLFSTHAKGSLDLYLANNIAYLRSPLSCQLVVTSDLNTSLFETIGVSLVSRNKPISLTISPDGFQFPLKRFDIADARISHGVLDLGKLVALNAGNPEDVGQLLERTSNPDKIDLWFAPLDFSIRGGNLDIGRTEILYDNMYDIAVWGTVDLVKEYVRMTVGLTAQTLKKAVGIQLPPNYVLRVPFRGPFHNVKLDKGRAAATIAALIAKQRAAHSNDTLSGIFGIIGELADDQSKVPKAKRPFPWEQGSRNRNSFR